MVLGAAIFPFAAILALCVFLLQLPSGETARIIDPSVGPVPQPVEEQGLPLANAEGPAKPDVPREPSTKTDASMPVAVEAVAEARSDAVSMMAVWWAHRERQRDPGPKKAVFSPRRSHRPADHRQLPAVSKIPVSRGQFGCPPSICFEQGLDKPSVRRIGSIE
jgi:hypothetical protein